MAGFFGGLIIGLICTFAGVTLTWLSGKGDRKKARELADAQARISELEEEKSKSEVLERFTPRIVVGGTPPSSQFITVTDSATFRVAEMDYLTSQGLKVSSQLVDRTGTSVQISIDESKVTEVQQQGCDPRDGSFSMSFRIHIEVDGVMKSCLLPVKVAVNSSVKLEPMPLGMQLSNRSDSIDKVR
ncbi:MAG TPA: hypothetical protein VD837_05375 [Terriglobales bacterium]|nr:hypothetical protein [Terriglobales bacterium]